MVRKNVEGSSMASVIVAFALLMMGIAMFTTVLYSAADILQGVEDLRSEINIAVENYYEGTEQDEESILTSSDIYFKDTETNRGFRITGQVYKFGSGDYKIYYFE